MYNPEGVTLPRNFAERVLELEVQLDERLSLGLIRELSELYSVDLT